MLLVVAASPNRERVAPEQRIVTVVPDLAYRGNFLTVGLWQSTPLAALYWTFPHEERPSGQSARPAKLQRRGL